MNISYELAKQIKDAGFPLKKVGCHECDEGRQRLDGNRETLYAPTLSELIEACGEGFMRLGRANEPFNNDELWQGVGYFMKIYTLGSTPEEAVAKLWLELNKK